MKALLYGIGLQFRLDIRSKGVLVAYYIVPLVFFLFMGGVLTSIDGTATDTLIAAMSVFAVTMSALFGLPPAVAEIYGTDIKKVYKANGAPMCFGVVTLFISAFIHTMVVCMLIFLLSPIVFQANLPPNLWTFFASMGLLLAVTLEIGCIIGLLFKEQAKLTMIAMIVFLPSIMLSGIMFPREMLPQFLQYIAYALPATIAFEGMTQCGVWHLPVLSSLLVVLCSVIAALLKIRAKR